MAFAFGHVGIFFAARPGFGFGQARRKGEAARLVGGAAREQAAGAAVGDADFGARYGKPGVERSHPRERAISEEHTSELQSLMRISYAVFCLKKKQKHHNKSKTAPHKKEATRRSSTI